MCTDFLMTSENSLHTPPTRLFTGRLFVCIVRASDRCILHRLSRFASLCAVKTKTIHTFWGPTIEPPHIAPYKATPHTCACGMQAMASATRNTRPSRASGQPACCALLPYNKPTPNTQAHTRNARDPAHSSCGRLSRRGAWWSRSARAVRLVDRATKAKRTLRAALRPAACYRFVATLTLKSEDRDDAASLCVAPAAGLVVTISFTDRVLCPHYIGVAVRVGVGECECECVFSNPFGLVFTWAIKWAIKCCCSVQTETCCVMCA